MLAIVVSAVGAAAIIGLGGWLIFGSGGGDPVAGADVVIIPPAEASVADDAAVTTGASGSVHPAEPPAPVEIVVYVTGEVANPGVYSVGDGDRLADVVALAGGATDAADLNRVNLATHVSDAMHYRIPALGDAVEADVDSMDAPVVPDGRAAGKDAEVESCGVPVNINTASVECLDSLPGIGAVRAQSIVDHREQTGPFATADGITAVSGIGSGIHGRIAGLITVGGQ